MEYKFSDIEKKWQQWWKDNDVYKVSNPSTSPGRQRNRNIMCWICFRIQAVRVCMWDIRWDILPVIFMHGLND